MYAGDGRTTLAATAAPRLAGPALTALRVPALALLLIAALSACGGGSSSTKSTATYTATARSTTGAAATSAPGVAASDPASVLFGAANPFQLLNTLSGQPSDNTPVDERLTRVLLKAGDLPNGFSAPEGVSHSISTEYGQVELAANTFTKGDISGGNFEAIVVSAAVSLPQPALDELNKRGGIQTLGSLTDADLQQLTGTAEEVGVQVVNVRKLDASGLGDGGLGMHLVIDFSALFEAFGVPAEENPFAGGLADDLYMFLRGDHLFIVMVMSPGGASSGIDGRALAEKLDANAAKVF